MNPGTRIRIYVGACFVAALILGSFAVNLHPFRWQAAAAFGLLAFIVAQFPLSLANGALYDITFLITIAAIVQAGPGVATIATVCATVSLQNARDRSAIRHTFNAAQLAITAASAGLVYIAAGGPTGPHFAMDVTSAILPLALATAANFVVNTGLVSGAIAISETTSWFAVWRRGYRGVAQNYVAFSALGFLLAVLRAQVGWYSVIFLLMPLLVARQAFQAAVIMQGAFDATVGSLIKAIEAKDPYTRGHAQRVSRLAEMTARAYGLSPSECRAIRYAALMHDVGKLGVDSKVLKKPGKLTAEEYEHMKIHPVRGVEIVGDIDLLRDVLDGVRHHHERMDGSGYPDGLIGDQIPLFARLIMVSDAFDSMTSTRVYRKAKNIEEAFIELRRCAGTQFDQQALAALQRAIDEQGWEPAPEADDEDEDVEAAHALVATL